MYNQTMLSLKQKMLNLKWTIIRRDGKNLILATNTNLLDGVTKTFSSLQTHLLLNMQSNLVLDTSLKDKYRNKLPTHLSKATTLMFNKW